MDENTGHQGLCHALPLMLEKKRKPYVRYMLDHVGIC